jgi:hypothetical protein
MKNNEPDVTCQICGRPIKAKKGLIAHHGYTRPYKQGWQTSSCMGARYRPYEVACDRIPVAIEAVKNHIVVLENQIKDLKTNPPETITYFSWGGRSDQTYSRPENFTLNGSFHGEGNRYQVTLKNKIYYLEIDLKNSKIDFEYLTKRLADWKAPEENANENNS